MKKRIVPTHFMELYINKGESITQNGGLFGIHNLKLFLNNSVKYELTTVAIWKICKKKYNSKHYIKAMNSIGKTVKPLK